MKRFLTTTAAVAILAGSAGLAAADCNIVDTDVETQLRENPDTRAGYSVQFTRDLRELRNAATTLAMYGKDGACQEVADAMNELASNPKEAKRNVGDGEMMTGWRMDDTERSFETARNLSDSAGRLRANEILGADVRGRENDTIGEISDIVFDPNGSPAYAVVAYGGFLGLGEDESAIPFEDLKVSEDGDVFFIAMNEQQLEEAPRFQRGNFDWIEDEDWREKNDVYYKAMRNSG